MRKKKIGRPPAQWVHELKSLAREDSEFLDYQELSEILGVSLRSVHGFCTENEVEGEFYKHNSNAIRKRFSVKTLKKAAAAYLKKHL